MGVVVQKMAALSFLCHIVGFIHYIISGYLLIVRPRCRYFKRVFRKLIATLKIGRNRTKKYREKVCTVGRVGKVVVSIKGKYK